MSDFYTEQLIKKQTTGKDRMIKILLILLTVVSVLIIFIFPFGIILPVALIALDVFMFQRMDVEYEYLFVNGDLDIDKIMHKARRKRVCSVNINDVEMFRKKSLYVTRENAVKLKKNEYFIADLIGLKMISDEGEDLGELTDVLQTGANDVYVISKEGADDILLPAIKDCVKQVDIEGGTMQVHLLDGLRDLNSRREET